MISEEIKDQSKRKGFEIPDTPKNIIKAVFNTPPKKLSEWKYIKNRKG